MSWSVNAIGTPSEVKELVAKQFDSGKKSTASVANEQKSVELAEQISNLLLDHLIESDFPEVSVSGYGSGSNTNPTKTNKGNISFSLTVKPIG